MNTKLLTLTLFLSVAISARAKEDYHDGSDYYIWDDWQEVRSGLSYRPGVRINSDTGEVATLAEFENSVPDLNHVNFETKVTGYVVNVKGGERFNFSIPLPLYEKKIVSHVILEGGPVDKAIIEETEALTEIVTQWRWHLDDADVK